MKKRAENSKNKSPNSKNSQNNEPPNEPEVTFLKQPSFIEPSPSRSNDFLKEFPFYHKNTKNNENEEKVVKLGRKLPKFPFFWGQQEHKVFFNKENPVPKFLVEQHDQREHKVEAHSEIPHRENSSIKMHEHLPHSSDGEKETEKKRKGVRIHDDVGMREGPRMSVMGFNPSRRLSRLALKTNPSLITVGSSLQVNAYIKNLYETLHHELIPHPNLEPFGIPDNLDLIELVESPDKIHSSPMGNKIWMYMSPVLRSWIPFNMNHRYRGMNKNINSTKAIDVLNLDDKDLEDVKIKLAKAEKDTEVPFDDLKGAALSELHFRFLRDVSEAQLVTLPFTLLYTIMKDVENYYDDLISLYARQFSFKSEKTKQVISMKAQVHDKILFYEKI